ncbi:hypothetical protein AB8810_12765 [Xanthomonas sp. NCPPB 3005]|uniref:hypothetical protein n=1 Tax=Xanthomonas sp. NCPPB 3005 TaxID=3240913 RepID=UPI0035130F41
MDEELKALLKAQTSAMQEHTLAITKQNDLLLQIVAMNADLMATVAGDQDAGGEPAFDLAGRPING